MVPQVSRVPYPHLYLREIHPARLSVLLMLTHLVSRLLAIEIVGLTALQGTKLHLYTDPAF